MSLSKAYCSISVPPAKIPKEKAVVVLRLDPEEKSDLQFLAGAAGLPMSYYLRMKVQTLLREEFAKLGAVPNFVKFGIEREGSRRRHTSGEQFQK